MKSVVALHGIVMAALLHAPPCGIPEECLYPRDNTLAATFDNGGPCKGRPLSG